MKNTLLQHHQSDGFTLIEVLIALAVAGIILTGVFMAFSSQQASYLAQDQVVEMQENIRAGVGIIVQELRMAGYDPGSSGNVGIGTANTTSVSFTYIADNDGQDNNNDGVIDETNEIETINFSFNDADSDGDMDIIRTDAYTTGAIAENFQALEFNYLDDNGNTTSILNNIKNVQISVLARSQQPDRHYANNSTYTSAAGNIWGPYNDNFRRRFQIITVNLRNRDT